MHHGLSFNWKVWQTHFVPLLLFKHGPDARFIFVITEPWNLKYGRQFDSIFVSKTFTLGLVFCVFA